MLKWLWRASRGSQLAESAVLLGVVGALGAAVLAATPGVGDALTDRYVCEVTSTGTCAPDGGRRGLQEAGLKDGDAAGADTTTNTLGEPDPHLPISRPGGGDGGWWDRGDGEAHLMDWCSAGVTALDGIDDHYCTNTRGEVLACTKQFHTWSGATEFCNGPDVWHSDVQCDLDVQQAGSYLCRLSDAFDPSGRRLLRCRDGAKAGYLSCTDTTFDHDRRMGAPELCGSYGTALIQVGPCLSDTGSLYWCNTEAMQSGQPCTGTRDILPDSGALTDCADVGAGAVQCTFHGVDPDCVYADPDLDPGIDPDGFGEPLPENVCVERKVTVRCQVSAATGHYEQCLSTGGWFPDATAGVVPGCQEHDADGCTRSVSVPLAGSGPVDDRYTDESPGLTTAVAQGYDGTVLIPDAAGTGTREASLAEVEEWCTVDRDACDRLLQQKEATVYDNVVAQMTAAGMCTTPANCQAEMETATRMVTGLAKPGRCPLQERGCRPWWQWYAVTVPVGVTTGTVIFLGTGTQFSLVEIVGAVASGNFSEINWKSVGARGAVAAVAGALIMVAMTYAARAHQDVQDARTAAAAAAAIVTGTELADQTAPGAEGLDGAQLGQVAQEVEAGPASSTVQRVAQALGLSTRTVSVASLADAAMDAAEQGSSGYEADSDSAWDTSSLSSYETCPEFEGELVVDQQVPAVVLAGDVVNNRGLRNCEP